MNQYEIDILDDMYDFETDFDQEEKWDGDYFLGIYVCRKDVHMLNSGERLVNELNRLYLGMAISPKLFFKYEYKYIQKYLYSTIKYCPYAKNYSLHVSIMKLDITDDGLCLVIIKTYWLKIIQRHWKKIMKKRKEIIEKMNRFSYIKKRELGKYDRENMPTFNGMLSVYSNKKL